MKNSLIDLHQDLSNYFMPVRSFLNMKESDFKYADTDNRPCDLEGYLNSNTKLIFAASFPLTVDQEGISHKKPRREIEKSLKVYQSLVAKYDNFCLIKNTSNVNLVLNRKEKIGLILHIEGGECLQSEEDVEFYFKKGVRSIGLTWNYPNYLAGGSSSNQGLTEMGRLVLRKMKAHKMILDLTHLNEKSFFEVLEEWHEACMVSHTAVKTIHDHPQNLSDIQIKQVIDHDGIVGLSFLYKFYGENGTLENVADHLQFFRKNFGTKNIAIGSDYFGFEQGQSIKGLERIESVDSLRLMLKRRGWKEDEVESLLWKNAHRFIMYSLPTN